MKVLLKKGKEKIQKELNNTLKFNGCRLDSIFSVLASLCYVSITILLLKFHLELTKVNLELSKVSFRINCNLALLLTEVKP